MRTLGQHYTAISVWNWDLNLGLLTSGIALITALSFALCSKVSFLASEWSPSLAFRDPAVVQ